MPPSLIPILLSALFVRFIEPALQLHHGIQARFRRAPARLRFACRMRGLLCSLAFTLSDQFGARALPLEPLSFPPPQLLLFPPGFIRQSRGLAFGHDGQRASRHTRRCQIFIGSTSRVLRREFGDQLGKSSAAKTGRQSCSPAPERAPDFKRRIELIPALRQALNSARLYA